ncbi:MAG: elongation factor G [Elusimicrobiota bacterium]
MQIYKTEELRNVAVCGSRGTGKSQLVESILFSHGQINRLGLIEEKNTVSDYEELEKERQSSISSSVISLETDKNKINIIDTPGFADFFGGVVSGMAMSEFVLLVINPHEGIDVTTRKIWNRAKNSDKPVIIYVNFMDNANKNFGEIVNSLKDNLSPNMAPVTVPVGKADNFKGIVKLLDEKAVIDGEEGEIPEDMAETISGYSESLMDSVATVDDDLMVKYLEEENLSSQEIIDGLSKGLLERDIVPVLCGSATEVIGVKELIDFINKYAPSPADVTDKVRPVEPDKEFRSLVFKAESQEHVGQVNYIKLFSGNLTTGSYIYNLRTKNKERINQIAVKQGKENIKIKEAKAGDICALIKLEDAKINDTLAEDTDQEPVEPIDFPEPIVDRGVYPATEGEEEKVANAFSDEIDADPTLKFEFNSTTKEMVLTGMGSLQLNLLVKKIRKRFNVEVDLTTPKIPYKETIRKIVNEVQARHKKQSGGRGQYGECVINVAPQKQGKGFEFVDKITGGAIPSNYIPAVEKGIKEAKEKGVIAGYPVVDFKVELVDGSYHEVDSSDMAFQIAGSMAFKKAMKNAQPYILEPIMKVNIKVTNDYTGDVMGDLNSRRGRVLGMEPASGDMQIIKAYIPKSSLTTYTEDLRSITSGAGEYDLEFDHYEEAPRDVQQNLVEQYERQKEEGR